MSRTSVHWPWAAFLSAVSTGLVAAAWIWRDADAEDRRRERSDRVRRGGERSAWIDLETDRDMQKLYADTLRAAILRTLESRLLTPGQRTRLTAAVYDGDLIP